MFDLCTVLATALWALAGMVCIHDAGKARSSREFLFGLGLCATGVLLGVDLLPHASDGGMPLAPLALLATAIWAFAAPHRHELDGAERLRLLVGVVGIGLLLHATSLLWPQQPVIFGHWRAVELPVAGALTVLALRAHLLPLQSLPALRAELPLLLGLTAGSCVLAARATPGYGLAAATLLAMAPLPLLYRRARVGDRVVPLRAAVATAGTFVCVLASGEHGIASRLDRLAAVQADAAQVQQSLRSAQLPLDRALADWTIEQSRTAYDASVTDAEAAIQGLGHSLRLFAVRGSGRPLANIELALRQHREHAAQQFAQIERRSAHWNDDAARTAAEANATVANREAAHALIAADVAFAELLRWQHATSAATADSAWETHRGILSLLLLLSVMAMAVFVSSAPATAAAPAAAPAASNLLVGVDQEVRRHLTTMLGSAELILEPGTEATMADHAQAVVTQGRRLASLLDDINDLERVEQRRLQLHDQMFAIDELCQAAVHELEAEAQAKGIAVELVVSPELSRWVHGDPRQLRRMLGILLTRAIAQTPIGAVTLQVTGNDGTLQILVTDGGPSLDLDTCLGYFDLPTSNEDANIGRSLGIVLCHRLAATMGGALRIASEPGRGSELTLQLPLRPAETWEVELEEEDAQQTASTSSRSQIHVHGRVLLVEDARDHQLTIGHILERAGAEVTLAENGEVALQLLLHEHFELVLMDLQMPGMDGLEATRQLRERDSETPVVALTADTTDADRERCLAAGCNGHLPKPIERRKLEQTLAMYLQPVGDELMSGD